MTADLAAEPFTVTAPGMFDALPESDYFRDPVTGGSLSHSGAKLLLPPGCPAKFQWAQTHPRPPKAAFDFGHAVHAMVLGVGAPVVVVDADDWRGKTARERKAEAYAAGHIPMLTAEWDAAKAAADAVAAHPIAGPLLTGGKAEQSLFWQDEPTGVWRRSRLDYLTELPNGRVCMVDLKTARSSEPREFAKAVANYGYHSQQAFYTDGVTALGISDDPAFLFVVVETEAPHVVTVCELDADAVAVGAARNRRALDLYAACKAADYWPGYSEADDIPLITLPSWALREDYTT